MSILQWTHLLSNNIVMMIDNAKMGGESEVRTVITTTQIIAIKGHGLDCLSTTFFSHTHRRL